MNTVKQAMNGVDVERLEATVKAIEATPSLARFQFRSINRWIDGGHNRSTIKGFFGAGQEDETRRTAFVMDNDEPDVLLGKDQGANPVEYVLHALAGCLTTTLVYHAAARGIRIESLESSLEGDLDLRGLLGIPGAVRSGYDQVRVSFRIRADVPDSELQDLLQYAMQRSPVMDIVSNPVAVTVRLDS